MNGIQMVDLQGQYQKIKKEVDSAIEEVINSAAFINGEQVKNFAFALEKYLNVKHVIPCANGTDALQIALMALDLQPGDEVITTPFTFVATAEVIALLKLKPVFVDIDPDTFNIDVSKIEEVITSKSKCIIPVHLFGQCCDMEAIMKIAGKHNLFVVEDNAQAIGSEYTFPGGKKQKAGTIGDIGCTSFFPSKNLGCFGDGGAIFTNNDDMAFKIRMVVNHGQKERYHYSAIGVNSRLDSIQAAILNIKLARLDEYISARQVAAKKYNELFSDSPEIITPLIAPYSTHVFHQYSLLIDGDRNLVQQELQKNNIPAMIYYPIPLHLHEAYSHYGYKKGDFPVSEDIASKIMSLPMHTELSEEQLNFIGEHVLQATSKVSV